MLIYRDDSRHQVLARDVKAAKESVLYQAAAPFLRIRSVRQSPDGKWVAFVISRDAVLGERGLTTAAATSLILVPTDGGPVRELYSATWPELILPVQGHTWTADSSRILFVKGRGRSLALWSIAVTGGRAEPTGLAMEGLQHPTVPPSGLKLAFASGDRDTVRVESLLPR